MSLLSWHGLPAIERIKADAGLYDNQVAAVEEAECKDALDNEEAGLGCTKRAAMLLSNHAVVMEACRDLPSLYEDE